MIYAFLPSLCSTEKTIPPSRPAIPDAWQRMAVKDGRRPPRQRRVASLRAIRCHATLDAGGACSGALPSSASGRPLQCAGSGSGKPIKYRPRNPIKQRAHAHRPPCTHAPTRLCRLFQNSDDGADALTEASNAVVDLIQAGKPRCGRAGRARSPHPLSQTRMMATTGSAWSARPATIAARPPTTTAR